MPEKRIVGLLIFAFLISSGLAVRLFSISVLQHKEYLAKAQNQQMVERDILPRRGDIYIQDNTTHTPTLVAQSIEHYSLAVTPANVVRKAEYAQILAKYSGQDATELQKKLEENGLYLMLKHGLSKEEVDQLVAEINTLERSKNEDWTDQQVNFDTSEGITLNFTGGVYFIREFQRVYPEGSLLAQVLGFVNDEGIGKYGFESQYDKELKGYSGRLTLQQDVIGTLLSQTESIEGKNGTSYELSIDRNVQYVAERELAQEIKDSEAEGGSVIIMDPKTGEIIAMANQPTYDPSKVREVKPEDINLFDNPAISNSWEPGSIFKPLVMAAALDQGLVTPQTKEEFGAFVTVEGYKIETALRRAYGVETMTQVLENSDNVAMVWVANKLGNEKMYDYLKKFGFGSYTGIDLKNEISGSLMDLSKWRDINRATMSFGQGIAVTPLQVATAFAAIANDGRMVEPRVVHAVIDANGNRREIEPTFGEQVVKPETAKQLRDMMVATVVNAHSRAGTEGYKIGGKTGTAQIPDPEKGGYLPEAYNHSFVGIGPSDDPKYVMLVKIDHPNLKKVGIYAEGTAVPLFGRISSFLLNYYQIPPTNR